MQHYTFVRASATTSWRLRRRLGVLKTARFSQHTVLYHNRGSDYTYTTFDNAIHQGWANGDSRTFIFTCI